LTGKMRPLRPRRLPAGVSPPQVLGENAGGVRRSGDAGHPPRATPLGHNSARAAGAGGARNRMGQRMARNADGSPSLNMSASKPATGDRRAGDRGYGESHRRGGAAAHGFSGLRVDRGDVSDFANVLKKSPRYRDAIAAGGDSAYIDRIGKSGYADDPELRLVKIKS